MKTILVTGGAGFIGTHLCRALVREGHSVRSLDLRKPPEAVTGVSYTQGDIRDSASLQAALQGVDAVFHFAAIVSVPYCQAHPSESYSTNFTGTLQIIEAIREEQKTRKTPIHCIFASSAAVYGHLGKRGTPLKETQAANPPISFYGAQKLGSEHLFQLHFPEVRSTVFRFFNVYGIGQDPSSPYTGVITSFANQIRNQQPIRVFGTGNQTRDFIAVEDIVSACISALNRGPARAQGAPMNLGSGKSITIRELARLAARIGSASHGKIKIVKAAPRSGDILHSCAQITRARTSLKWKPKRKLLSELNTLFSILLKE